MNNTPLKENHAFQASKIFKASAQSIYKHSPKTQYEYNLLPTPPIGWELEIEGWGYPNVSEVISNSPFVYSFVTEDGSLKDMGAELVTKGGLTDRYLFASLLEIGWINENLLTGFKFSHRCSFHIHMDVRNWTVGNLKTFIALFILTEPLLQTLCEDHRKGNSYCTPLNQLNLQQSQLHQYSWNDSKYWALSLNRLNDLGTVEIRMHHGSANIDSLQQWIKTFQQMWHFCSSTKFQDFQKLIKSFNTYHDVQKLCTQIFDPVVTNNLEHISREIKDSLFNTQFFLEN